MAAVDDVALARALRELTDQLSPDALVRPLTAQLAAVVSATAPLLGAESVGILLLDDDDRVRGVAASGRAAEALETAQARVGVGPGVDALVGGAMVAVEDVVAAPRHGALWQEIATCRVRAVLAAPIWLDGQVVGILHAVALHAVAADPHVWSDPQRRAAEAVAGIVGQMLGLAARPALGTGGDGEGVAQ
jgi:GAF domain-containing protein